MSRLVIFDRQFGQWAKTGLYDEYVRHKSLASVSHAGHSAWLNSKQNKDFHQIDKMVC